VAAAFAPYGHVIEAPDVATTADFGGEKFQAWGTDFSADGPVQVMVVHYDPQPLRRLERHVAVSQTFIPLAGQASVMVVAAPDVDAGELDPAAVHAFLVPGDVGVLLRRGTWHALTRFPVGPGGGGFVMITGDATQKELEGQVASGASPTLTHLVDFADQGYAPIDIIDPAGLIAGI
jgi:ureidoglycolate lyase